MANGGEPASKPAGIADRAEGYLRRARDLTDAGERTRTSDPRITNALLYQLSYSGVEGRMLAGRGAAVAALARPAPVPRAGIRGVRLDA